MAALFQTYVKYKQAKKTKVKFHSLGHYVNKTKGAGLHLIPNPFIFTTTTLRELRTLTPKKPLEKLFLLFAVNILQDSQVTH